MEYVNRQTYLAQVTDQGFSEDKNGNPFFKLFFKVLGKVPNKYKPDTYEPEESLQEHEIQFRFDPTRPDLLEWRIKDLQKLGMDGDDPTVLSPTHENHKSFVGQKILVSPNVQERDGKNITYWNLVFVTIKKFNEVSNDKVNAKIGDAWKKAVARMRAKETEEKNKPKEEEEDLPDFAKS